jgi:hypothetical protein
LSEIGGASLLMGKYNGVLSNLLAEVYPENEWLPWKFVICPHNYWDDMKNQRKFIDWAAKQLNIKEKSDWYNVTVKCLLIYDQQSGVTRNRWQWIT